MKININAKSILLLTAIFLLFSTRAHAVSDVRLEVEIDIENSIVRGTMKTYVSAGEEVRLETKGLYIGFMRLGGTVLNFERSEGVARLVLEKSGLLSVSYSGVFKERAMRSFAENPLIGSVIGKQGVSLTGLWYPAPEGLARYDLSVTLPEGYTAISEADVIRVERKGGKSLYSFSFPYKTDSINLVASDKYIIAEDKLGDIDIYAYFFKDDIGLARTYIEYTKKYLAMYEKMLGKYPYSRFSIVENFLPTGYSMPTFTLLGSSVVKLPFIVDTSLGHEIAHQWFGNSVYIDYDSGNWAEGLTTYLADHYYREQKGEGWQYRKQMLINHQSYVTADNDLSLADFRVGKDRASRAIGYNKTAMVFHMLRNHVGDDMFFASLKDLIETKRFQKASWQDISSSFEKVYGKSLAWFFEQWVEKKGLIDITMHSPELTQSGTGYDLHFHIDQAGDVFRIKLPVTVYFENGASFYTLDLNEKTGMFELNLRQRPVRMVLDEDYDIARVLGNDERPPVISRLFGGEDILIALPEKDSDVYRSIIKDFKARGADVNSARDITVSDIEGHTVIVLSIDNPLIRRLWGTLGAEDAGFYLLIRENPWNLEKVIAVISAESSSEVEAAFRKLPHYGKYSKLLFKNGRNTRKHIESSDRGMVMGLAHEVSVVEVSAIRALPDVIKSIRDKRIVYVGEVHDVFAHHAVQLDIITAIHKMGRPVAIGMEMFERSFQETLDLFIQGRIGEKDFLRRSEYFRRWGFDYKLYKPILDFARTENIPVKALNLRREIISKVGEGGIGSLTEKEIAMIPDSLDFSDKEYMQRLKEVYSMHKISKGGRFENFYQSQILWDEIMSFSVDEYLKANPDHVMVVLAGQGHLRYGSGIPKRTYRRNGLDYSIVLIDEEVERGIADFVLFPKPVEGITTPKLMVFLSVKDGRLTVSGFPERSVSEKGGLKAGDRLLRIDEVKIQDIDDIRIHLVGKRKGDTVILRIEREADKADKELDIKVEL